MGIPHMLTLSLTLILMVEAFALLSRSRAASPFSAKFRLQGPKAMQQIEKDESVEGSGDTPDYDLILQQIREDSAREKEMAVLEERDKRRQVVQKRKDKEYEKYWERQKARGGDSKEQATMKFYYKSNSTLLNSEGENKVVENLDNSWDYSAVPVSPKENTVSTLTIGLTLLAALVAGKKLTTSDQPVKKRAVKNAINVPGVGVVSVE